MGRPLGEVSHRLLHRTYTDRSARPSRGRGRRAGAAHHVAAAAGTMTGETCGPMDGVITTIKQNCRRCYTCVRDCPAKAIRIEDGQASVVAERCISCGNCTMVCSQDAKAYTSGIEGPSRCSTGAWSAALLAPSFPAGFTVPPGQIDRCACARRASPTWSKWPTGPTW